jgi:hypothetical protein
MQVGSSACAVIAFVGFAVHLPVVMKGAQARR